MTKRWLCRPYESDIWEETDIQPTDELRRFLEFKTMDKPVEGLETELICNRSADRASVEDEWRPWSEWRIGQPHFSEEWLAGGLFKNEHVEFVTKSQAEAIIAALTARVKELEGDVFHDQPLGITWKQICEQFDKECQHHQQRSEALETQLASAEEFIKSNGYWSDYQWELREAKP